jgi:hypothetical protein
MGSHKRRSVGVLSAAFAVCAAALVGLTVVQAASADKTVLENTFKNERLGFSIRYPADWEYKLGKDRASVFLSGKERSPAYLINLGVYSKATKAFGGEHAGAESLLGKFRANLAKQHPKARFTDVQKNDYTAGGVKTKAHLLQVEYERTQGDNSIPMKTMFFCVSPLDGRRIYALVYTAPVEYRGAKVFGANMRAVSAVMNSFTPIPIAGVRPATPAKRVGKSVRVRVIGSDGKRLAGSGAVLLRGPGSFVEIGRDGEVTFDNIPAGTYEVMVLWAGYATSNTKLDIRPGVESLIRMPRAAKEGGR